MSSRKTILWLLLLPVCARGLGADTPVPTNAPAAIASLPRYSLWQAIDLALKQNPDVLIARKKVEEAAGGVIEARAGFLPSLGTWGNYEKFEESYASLQGFDSTERNEVWNLSVRLTETAYAGGAVAGKMSIARLTRQTSLLNYQAAADRVMMDVRVAFCQILKDKAGIAVHQEAVNFLQRQLDYEHQRLQIGAGQRLNSLRAEVDLSLEKAALIEARNFWRNDYIQLSQLLAIPYSANALAAPFEVDGELGVPPFSLNLENCMAAALQHRPELKARENDVAAQKKQLIVDRSALLPHVSLFAGYDVVSEPDRALPDDYYKGYVAGVGVNWNIFDGFATRGRALQTRARIDQAEIARTAQFASVRGEVILAYQDLQRALETVRSQRENVDLARESQSLAESNFKEGMITQLDLLQSRLDLTRAQSVELNARFDYNAALARLQRAIGSEFKVFDDKEGK